MKYLKLIILLFTLTSVYAGGLNIQIPEDVKVGDEFNIALNVENNQSIVGFECEIRVPYNLKIVNFSGNDSIKKMAGKFYQERITNNSCTAKFVVFDNPIKSDFYAGNITVKVVKYNNNTHIKISSKCSDEDGNGVNVFDEDMKIKIKKEEIAKSEKKGILGIIIDFMKQLLGE
jgi:hypothetical protein